MPVVMRHKRYVFYFYSNEGNPTEPAHIHVRAAGCGAKFWLHPNVRFAKNEGFTLKDLRELISLIEENRQRFEEAWNAYFP